MYGLLRSGQMCLVSGASLLGAGGWGWSRQGFWVRLGSTLPFAVRGTWPCVLMLLRLVLNLLALSLCSIWACGCSPSPQDS